MGTAWEGALDPLPDGYRDLFEKVRVVAEADDRVRALWLSGSLAKGTADVGSDLDVLVAIRDEDLDSFAEGWREWLESITTPLVARPLTFAPGSFYSTNVDCLRLDVVAEPVGKLPESPFATRVLVFDKDGVDAQVPEEGPARPGPDPEKMAWLAEEYFRQLALFPQAVAGRQDWLMGVVGVQGNRQMLYDVFVQANQPLPPMGVKQWSKKLTAAQQAVLKALPPLDATPESVTAGMRATADAWATAGREALESAGVEWPERLATAARAYFDRELPA